MASAASNRAAVGSAHDSGVPRVLPVGVPENKLKKVAGSLTPTRGLEAMGRMLMVEVRFDLKDGRKPCLPRYTHPEADRAVLRHQLGWELSSQPSADERRRYSSMTRMCGRP